MHLGRLPRIAPAMLASLVSAPLATASPTQVVGKWVDVGPIPLTNAGIICTQIAVSHGDVVHVSFQDEGVQAFPASVLRLKDGQWSWLGTRGKASIGRAWYNHLAFDSQDRAYLACRDYAVAGAAGVRVCNSDQGDWSSLPGGLCTTDAHYTQVLLDGADVPYVVFTDATSVPHDRALLRRLENGAWETVGNDYASPGTCAYPSFAFVQGAPWVAVMDQELSNRATVMRLDLATGQWVLVGPRGFSPSTAHNIRLAVDPGGVPHVASLGYPDRVSVHRWSGSAWEPVGGPASGSDAATIQTESWRQWLSLAFDPAGRPYVAYQDKALGNRLTVRRFDATDWVVLGKTGFTPVQADYHALAVDGRGVPFVSFRNGRTGASLGVMTFAEGVESYCSAKQSSLGTWPAIDILGAPDLHGFDDFRVVADHVPNHQPGLLMWGHAGAAIPAYHALLCIRPPLVRTPVQSSGGSTQGHDDSGTYSLTFSHTYMQVKGWTPGTTIFAQYWFRDPAHPDGSGVGLTGGIKFTVE